MPPASPPDGDRPARVTSFAKASAAAEARASDGKAGVRFHHCQLRRTTRGSSRRRAPSFRRQSGTALIDPQRPGLRVHAGQLLRRPAEPMRLGTELVGERQRVRPHRRPFGWCKAFGTRDERAWTGAQSVRAKKPRWAGGRIWHPRRERMNAETESPLARLLDATF